jgi:hypothetical protein
MFWVSALSTITEYLARNAEHAAICELRAKEYTACRLFRQAQLVSDACGAVPRLFVDMPQLLDLHIKLQAIVTRHPVNSTLPVQDG